jgi:hypothetical protein
MFTSAADVFRTRQIRFDLAAHIAVNGQRALGRMSSGPESLARLRHVLDGQGGRFSFPDDLDVYGEVLLAAALPDDDFPAFTCGTALLLLDRLGDGDGEDDLYWNWDAFSDYYRLADPQIRATLLNAFRHGVMTGKLSVSSMPEPSDCFTRPPKRVLPALRAGGHNELVTAIEEDASPESAGALWLRMAQHEPAAAALVGIRYLFERPESLAPVSPETAPLIRWSI